MATRSVHACSGVNQRGSDILRETQRRSVTRSDLQEGDQREPPRRANPSGQEASLGGYPLDAELKELTNSTEELR